MYAMQNEMGETLEKTLKLFRKSPYYVGDLISYEVPYDLVKKRILELAKREYLERTDGKICNSLNDVTVGDEFCITVKGTDYLELRTHWWEIFRVQSVYIPIAVAFATSVASEFIKPSLFSVVSGIELYLLNTMR